MFYPITDQYKVLSRLVCVLLFAVSALTGVAVVALGGYYLYPALQAAGCVYLAFSPLLAWVGMRLCYVFSCAIEL